jgi:hypothetical protein
MFALIIITITLFLGYSNSKFVPKCSKCKSFVPNKFNENLGYCKLFTRVNLNDSWEKLIYNYAKHCRDNEFLCGEEGMFFEKIDNKNLTNDYINLIDAKTIDEIELNQKILSDYGFFKSELLNDKNNNVLDDDEKKFFKLYSNNYSKQNLPRKNNKYKK